MPFVPVMPMRKSLAGKARAHLTGAKCIASGIPLVVLFAVEKAPSPPPEPKPDPKSKWKDDCDWRGSANRKFSDDCKDDDGQPTDHDPSAVSESVPSDSPRMMLCSTCMCMCYAARSRCFSPEQVRELVDAIPSKRSTILGPFVSLASGTCRAPPLVRIQPPPPHPPGRKYPPACSLSLYGTPPPLLLHLSECLNPPPSPSKGE